MVSDELSDGVTRRNVLKAGAATTGVVAMGAAGAAAQDGRYEKRGGRAQFEGDPQQRQRFQLSSNPTGIARNASCMAAESADQMYLEYDVEYCNGDEDTMYVIPDEAELEQDETYAVRATQECKDSDNTLVAFGPSRRDC